jgi:ABC-type transporter MlaC component
MILALVAAWLPASSALAAEGGATQRTEALIAAFKKVKTGADAKGNAAAYAELDGFLAFDTLTSMAIETRADKFTAAQRTEFKTTFRELVRQIAYANSGDFFRKAEVKVLAPKAKGDVTVVTLDTRLPEEDLETEVGLHWKQVDGKLQIVDVSFDGDSLVLDYRNQFTGIVDKEGVASLLAKANEKLAELGKAAKE